jgi:hypothetical protein
MFFGLPQDYPLKSEILKRKTRRYDDKKTCHAVDSKLPGSLFLARRQRIQEHDSLINSEKEAGKVRRRRRPLF